MLHKVLTTFACEGGIRVVIKIDWELSKSVIKVYFNKTSTCNDLSNDNLDNVRSIHLDVIRCNSIVKLRSLKRYSRERFFFIHTSSRFS